MTSSRSSRRALMGVALTLALAAAAVPAAWADGDPAGDLLAIEDVYVPPQSALSPVRRDQLRALLRRVRRDGLGVRVALISSPSNLGTETRRFNKPGNYADLLGLELSLAAPRDYVLVAMPAGLGTGRYRRRGVAALRKAIAGIPAAGVADADALALAAGRGVLAMAAATGQRVPAGLAAPFADRRARAGSHTGLILAVAALALAWLAALGGAFALRAARARRPASVPARSDSGGAG